MLEKLLTRKEASDALRVKPQTLAAWACRGGGPRLPVVRVGGAVRYRETDVAAIIAGTSQGEG